MTDPIGLLCRNCGDTFVAYASSAWRPCPNPSPGKPLVDCGIGGHMYDRRPEAEPSSTASPDHRTLIAEARRQDRVWRSGRCSAHDIECAESWAIANLGDLLDGYDAALLELAAVRAERKRLMRVILEPVLTPEQLANVMAVDP